MIQKNKDNIRATINTQGWQDILKIFEDEILNEKRRVKIDINKRYEEIALDTLARVRSALIVDRVLAKINKLAVEVEYKKESYK